jgi:hypothetical protein
VSKEKNKEKQRNMNSILYIIDKDQIAFLIRKTTKTRITKRPHLKMFNIRAVEHKKYIFKT